jgi:hypothetical protein
MTREEQKHQLYRVRLPGFVTEEEMGLGEVVKQMTYGVASCNPTLWIRSGCRVTLRLDDCRFSKVVLALSMHEVRGHYQEQMGALEYPGSARS